MIKMFFVINTIVMIIALIFVAIGINTLNNEEYNVKGIRYILLGTNVIGICIVLTFIFI